jgi:hypothetical protein
MGMLDRIRDPRAVGPPGVERPAPPSCEADGGKRPSGLLPLSPRFADCWSSTNRRNWSLFIGENRLHDEKARGGARGLFHDSKQRLVRVPIYMPGVQSGHLVILRDAAICWKLIKNHFRHKIMMSKLETLLYRCGRRWRRPQRTRDPSLKINKSINNYVLLTLEPLSCLAASSSLL